MGGVNVAYNLIASLLINPALLSISLDFEVAAVRIGGDFGLG